MAKNSDIYTTITGYRPTEEFQEFLVMWADAINSQTGSQAWKTVYKKSVWSQHTLSSRKILQYLEHLMQGIWFVLHKTDRCLEKILQSACVKGCKATSSLVLVSFANL